MLQRLDVLAGAVLAMLTLSSVAVLFARSIAISGEAFPQVAGVIPQVLARTDFGRAWQVRAAAVLLAWPCWRWCRLRDGGSSWLPCVLAAVIAYSRSATGHAGDHGEFALPVWNDCLHLLAAGIWGGTIVAYLLTVRPVLRRFPGRADVAAATVGRYSMLAAAGLALAAATGICTAWRLPGSWQALWTTRYGMILDAKLLLVAAMALLGAGNRFCHVPRVLAAARGHDPRGWAQALRRLALASLAEALLWLAILAAVALLLSSTPPASMPPVVHRGD